MANYTMNLLLYGVKIGAKMMMVNFDGNEKHTEKKVIKEQKKRR